MCPLSFALPKLSSQMRARARAIPNTIAMKQGFLWAQRALQNPFPPPLPPAPRRSSTSFTRTLHFRLRRASADEIKRIKWTEQKFAIKWQKFASLERALSCLTRLVPLPLTSHLPSHLREILTVDTTDNLSLFPFLFFGFWRRQIPTTWIVDNFGGQLTLRSPRYFLSVSLSRVGGSGESVDESVVEERKENGNFEKRQDGFILEVRKHFITRFDITQNSLSVWFL